MRTVELQIEDFPVDIAGASDIATDYSIAKFNSIPDRTSYRSIEFELADTLNNRNVLQNIQVLLNTSDFNRRLLKARMTANGIDQLILSCTIKKYTNRDGFAVRLYGGNIDFFSALKGLKLSDLPLSEYDHYRTPANIYDNRNNTDGLVYPVINYGTQVSVGNELYCEALYPGVFYHTLLSKIVSGVGYTLTGDLITDENMLKMGLPFSNNVVKYSDAKQVSENLASAKLNADTAVGIGVTTTVLIEAVEDLGHNIEPNGIYYVCPASAKYSFHMQGRLTRDATAAVLPTLRLMKYDGFAYETLYSMSFGVIAPTVSQHIDVVDVVCNKDDLIFFFCDGGDKGTVMKTGTIFPVVEPSSTGTGLFVTNIEDIQEPIEPGFLDLWECAVNLPDMLQSEIVLFLLQRFSSLIKVDEINKIVNITKFSTIVSKKGLPGECYDWSNKIDLSEKYISDFDQSEYGRINKCEYKSDKSDGDLKPGGTDFDFDLQNESLTPEKQLLSAPFAGTFNENILLQGLSAPLIKLWTLNDASEWEKTGGITPRVLIFEPITLDTGIDLVYYDALLGETTAYSGVTDFVRSWFVSPGEPFNLGFDNSGSTDYLPAMFNVISENKTLQIAMRLNDSDINQIDFFKPVWINYFSSWFYISLIEKYLVTKKVSTICHLIKI